MSSATTFGGRDRSVLRKQRRNGDTSRDGRGRVAKGPAILHYGFRPFFLAAALWAAFAVPLWLSIHLLGFELGGPFDGLTWHSHEMMFGYVGAVIAGFILTAVPNWTGRLPLSGLPLAGLFGLWALGRLSNALLPVPPAALLIDLAFPVTLVFVVWREVFAGRNWRNAPVAAMLTLFGIANLLQHLEGFGLVPSGIGIRLGLSTVALLIALIGGRIVPSFTRNWLVKQGDKHLPAEFGRLDKAALLTVVLASLAWLALPGTPISGIALSAAGIALALRLSRWRGLAAAREPIVAFLHLGYGWLALALLILGASALAEDPLSATAGLHALTAGAIGSMTLAVMTRASLGHTGRAIVADRWTLGIYGAVTLGAALRVAAPLMPTFYSHLLACGGMLWSAAFLMFALRYGPILTRPRLAG